MSIELDLEDLGGEEIAADFTNALVAAIECKRSAVMDYDLDRGIFIRVTVERITEEQFNDDPGLETNYRKGMEGK